MEELHFVYINANGRIGVHSIQSISYSENAGVLLPLLSSSELKFMTAALPPFY